MELNWGRKTLLTGFIRVAFTGKSQFAVGFLVIEKVVEVGKHLPAVSTY